MNDNRISDESIVPAKQTNNDATEASAESVEERGLPKGNALVTSQHWAQNQTKQVRLTRCYGKIGWRHPDRNT